MPVTRHERHLIGDRLRDDQMVERVFVLWMNQ
jgi:hypothetical protein